VDFESQNWLGHALIRGLVDLSNFAQQRSTESRSIGHLEFSLFELQPLSMMMSGSI
jgi:hypothetical protein